jgi:glycosyltransferase involved in cell wall biosynthesis
MIMKVSIVIVCLNSEKTIEETIQSILLQTYLQKELVIIDGGSSDNTLSIIEKYKSQISVFISEKDRGIYDAMNKGIKLATGEVIGVLNSDDFYSNQDVLKKIAACFRDKNVGACYGNIIYVDRKDTSKRVRYWKAGRFDKRKIKYGWIPPHPSFFVRKEYFEKFGYFNTGFSIAADYELMFRLIKNKVSFFYLDEDLTYMREGGYSATNIHQRIKGWRELYRAWRINGVEPPLLFFLYRPLFKVFQYIFK